jgi:hypothetical protein
MPGFLSRDFIRPLGTIIIQTERLLTNQTRILPGWKKINTTNASCCSRSRTDPTNKKITYPKLSPKHYYNYYSYLKKKKIVLNIALVALGVSNSCGSFSGVASLGPPRAPLPPRRPRRKGPRPTKTLVMYGEESASNKALHHCAD